MLLRQVDRRLGLEAALGEMLAQTSTAGQSLICSSAMAAKHNYCSIAIHSVEFLVAHSGKKDDMEIRGSRTAGKGMQFR